MNSPGWVIRISMNSAPMNSPYPRTLACVSSSTCEDGGLDPSRDCNHAASDAEAHHNTKSRCERCLGTPVNDVPRDRQPMAPDAWAQVRGSAPVHVDGGALVVD